MASILIKLRTEYFTEYSMKQYSKVKIYHGGKDFDLSKRWYVYFNYAHPTLKNTDGSPKLVQQNPIYYNINKLYHIKSERMKALKELRDDVEELLKKGWSPYENEESRIQYKASYSLDFALKIKKTEVKETTYKDYESRINQFKDFLNKENFIEPIDKIDKQLISKFLKTFPGAKNRNNVKAALSSIFSILSDESLIPFNFIKEIRNAKVRTKATKLIDAKTIHKAYELLKEQDQDLCVYIDLISIMFWRPIEIVRIKISDIDLSNKLMVVNTKGKDSKIKIIPSIIYDVVANYIENRTGNMFDLKAKSDIDKRGYMTERFRKFRIKNKLDSKLTPYSFRHYRITQLYLTLRETFNQEETIKQLSLITGHESKAIFNYIHTNDIELPEDYSDYLK
ncbi:tyrosine-type recombinase/integrase [Lutibacter maritimus]|uniref:Site-specific recombinase XerD n=1 Tax=Lutibacter maritimus TaxID=593133 RepID=A0A1I6NSN8_9FLAO|nr:site-specific integrase [Lutibacter maritimus]SFS30910.1 Site-specific recombinase XerD [Lutibacter maritimus]